ncbi:hypothetical protein HXX76_001189 [Chlamydomonas incerta]|uniref:U-box domain-containing protein n=1 Tax=Chlamydomonas incerta TaxID=51695 RepID=A0A835WBR8_CHLIN|nr:hypothetical protein HXX76_001189 [Chlamydomonas incerta]|eukprot:KAG2444436.1 hypothetical protein HXX76_001189 [Chlamydomonas incerta]
MISAVVEVAISDCEPYLRGVRVWASLKEVDCVLSALLQTLRDAACKGRLVGYLTADRVLARFGAAAARLDLALARLQDEARSSSSTSSNSSSGSDGASSCLSPGSSSNGGGVRLPAEALGELASVRQLLQRARFVLPPAHGDTLARYRAAANGLAANWGVLLAACAGVLQDTLQAPLLSKQVFEDALSELQAEVQLQQYVAAQLQPQQQQGPAPPGAVGDAGAPPGSAAAAAAAATAAAAARAEQDAQQLRVLMDVIRAHHAHPDCDAPLEFLCPLTHRLMQEPVLLHDTGHSYERSALEAWWAAGHRFCPRTGVPLRRLSTSPNHNLRSAVERWRLHCEMQLSFRPVINTLVAERLQQQKDQKQQAHKQQSAGKQQQLPGVQKPQEDAARSLGQRTVGLAERLQRLAVLETPLEDAATAAPAVVGVQGAGVAGPPPSGPAERPPQAPQRLQSKQSEDGEQLSAGLLKAAAAVVALAAAGSGGGAAAAAAGGHHAHSWGGVPLDVAAAASCTEVPAALLCFSDGGAGYGRLGAKCLSLSGSDDGVGSPHLDTPQRAGSAQLGDCDGGAAAAAAGCGSSVCRGGELVQLQLQPQAGPGAQAGHVLAAAAAAAAVAAAPGGLAPAGGSGSLSLISFSSVGAAATPHPQAVAA